MTHGTRFRCSVSILIAAAPGPLGQYRGTRWGRDFVLQQSAEDAPFIEAQIQLSSNLDVHLKPAEGLLRPRWLAHPQRQAQWFCGGADQYPAGAQGMLLALRTWPEGHLNPS